MENSKSMLNSRSTSIQAVIKQNEQDPLFQAILDISDEAIFILDKKDFTIIDCNSAAIKLFEASSKSQLINIQAFRLYNYEPLEFSVEKYNEELEKFGQYSQELSFRTCKQNVFWGKMTQKNIGFTNVEYTILKVTKSANYLKDDEWLSEILRTTTKSTGRQFFKQITRMLCNTFNAKYAFIARRIADDESRLKIFYFHGETIQTHYISLKDSFIENTMRGYTSFYPSKLCELFPNDKILKETGAQSFIGSPLFDSTGLPMGIIGVLHTSEMEEITNSRHMLGIIGSRTAAEIHRIRSKEMLRVQTKDLAEINQMKDKLLSVITNDLQAPLNTVLGYSSMLRNKIKDYSTEELSNKMGIMDSSLRNLYVLLENLSDWSKLQQGKLKVAIKQNNLQALLDDIKPYIKFLSELKNIAILNKVPAVLNVNADSYLARVIVRNIATYVLKNTMKSGSVTFDTELIGGKWLFIISSDNHSADPEEVNYVLTSTKQEFYISSKELSMPALGLFIAREFLKLQKTKLSVKIDDKKLEFFFELDRA